jgi:hypothetical protein
MNSNRKSARRRLAVLVTGLVLAVAAGSAAAATRRGQPGTFYGEPVVLGGGTGRTYITIGTDGIPLSYGAVFTESALSGYPADVHKLLHYLPMPVEAVPLTPLDHIEFRYWVHGHDPTDILGKEHFDVIPFLMNQEQRDQITAVGADKWRAIRVPRAECIPLGFIQIPEVDEFFAEPRYGTRYFDLVSFAPILNREEIITTTLFYGFYNGRMNFWEIPVTFDYLRTKSSEFFPIRLPRSVPKRGYYPTRYRFAFSVVTSEYRFALEGLVHR